MPWAAGILRVPVQERKQRNCHLKGHSHQTCLVFIIIIIVFSNDKACNGIWKRWKFQMFVYNWLWGPQTALWKFLSVIGLFLRLDTVQGLGSFVAKQGCQQAQLRLWAGTSCYPSLHVCGNLAWTNSSLCLCLDAELSSWSRCRTFRRTDWFLDILTLNYWSHNLLGSEHYFQRLSQDSLISQSISL